MGKAVPISKMPLHINKLKQENIGFSSKVSQLRQLQMPSTNAAGIKWYFKSPSVPLSSSCWRISVFYRIWAKHEVRQTFLGEQRVPTSTSASAKITTFNSEQATQTELFFCEHLKIWWSGIQLVSAWTRHLPKLHPYFTLRVAGLFWIDSIASLFGNINA